VERLEGVLNRPPREKQVSSFRFQRVRFQKIENL
jgi:hypothetical protein